MNFLWFCINFSKN